LADLSTIVILERTVKKRRGFGLLISRDDLATELLDQFASVAADK